MKQELESCAYAEGFIGRKRYEAVVEMKQQKCNKL